MADIIIVNPAFDGQDADLLMLKGFRFPLGILYIAAVLLEKGYSVKVIDLVAGKANLKRILIEEKPKIVGISGLTPTRFESFGVAKIVKSVFPQALTVYGGYHASATAQDTLESIPEIDIIVRGEGEITFLELCKAYINRETDLDQIAGISYKNNGRIIHNPDRGRIGNLDILPFPARNLVGQYRYRSYLHDQREDFLSLISSRGCPYECSFCAERAFWGNNFVKRSPRNVLDEIAGIIEDYNIRSFIFYDSNFVLDKNFIFSFCNEIAKRKIRIRWGFQTNISCPLDLEAFKIMKESGCLEICLGVESVITRILGNINKHYDLKQLEGLLMCASKVDMKVRILWMVGLPGETLDDAIATMNWFGKFKKHVALFSPRPTEIYPGTPLEAWAKERGYLPRHFSWDKPYYSHENRFLNSSVRQPLLIQPQFGYSEYRHIYKLFMRGRYSKRLTTDFILSRLKTVGNIKSLRHYYSWLRLSWKYRNE